MTEQKVTQHEQVSPPERRLLELDPGLGVYELRDGYFCVLDAKSAEAPIAQTAQSATGISQELHGVISAGEHQFGVVNTEVEGKVYSMLTRFSAEPEGRGEILGIMEPGITHEVGRESGGEHDPFISGRHFSVRARDDGSAFEIRDLHSTNGTFVGYPSRESNYSPTENPQSAPEKSAMRGLKRFLKNKTSNTELVASVEPEASTISESLRWAPSSQLVLEAINKHETKDALDVFLAQAIDKDNGNLQQQDYMSKMLISRAKQIMHTMSAEHPEIAGSVAEIVSNNSLGGHRITELLGKISSGDYEAKKLRFLEIFDKNAESAKAIIDSDIGGFHASQSGSILGVLRHGALLSAAESRRRGQNLSTGERTYSPLDGQESISFADWREPNSIKLYTGSGRTITEAALQQEIDQLAVAYEESLELFGENNRLTINAQLVKNDAIRQLEFMNANPSSVETRLMKLNFPVAYGVNIEQFDRYESRSSMPDKQDVSNVIIERVASDVPGEFVVLDNKISLAKLPVIAVPEQHIKDVREIFATYGHEVHVIDIALITDSDSARPMI